MSDSLHHEYPALALQHESSHRQYLKEQAWLSYSKTLFTKLEPWPRFGPQEIMC